MPQVVEHESKPTYIDIFAGCGGLSLGLHRAGWQGLFAVEKDEFAFSTLKENFLTEAARFSYGWPSWLEKKPWSVEDLISKHKSKLVSLRGKVDLVAGGPPCQGFSSAGRRKANDPRNTMVERYLEFIEILAPRILLLENVRGFTLDFKARSGRQGRIRKNAAERLIRDLSGDYTVSSTVVLARDFGVPQNRPRFILLAIRRDSGLKPADLDGLMQSRDVVLKRLGLSKTTSAKQAISDLEVGRNNIVACADSPGFDAVGYRSPRTAYQRAMRDGFKGPPSDTRLAKHSDVIRERFSDIIEQCRIQGRSNRQLSREMREKFGLKKMATRVLDPEMPAPTITSMPDDLIHYSEPRTLTVRENARLQSFPDWFSFHGKYTTGGHLRRVQIPRFTQVANAVPPLLAQIIGDYLIKHYLCHCVANCSASGR